ncbi:hypothetical protein VNO80_15123 [Phaseolus coccineus]|uniref:Pentatricopeptide repeat-containing protein n=1 Tax=Phaseolus coccineus TaxID=3886 RepID=A0AAN9MJP3_PHACN
MQVVRAMSTSTYNMYIHEGLEGVQESWLLSPFLLEMRDSHSYDIKSEIFWLIFKAYSRANLPDGAIRSFNRMYEVGVMPIVHDLDKLLYSLCKRKHVKLAEQVFDKDINSLLGALCNGDPVDEAKNVFHDMLSKRVEPDAFTYSIFIHSYCDSNDLQSAFRVLDRMRRIGRFDKVTEVWENMVDKYFYASVSTYAVLIHGFCKKKGKLEEAGGGNHFITAEHIMKMLNLWAMVS